MPGLINTDFADVKMVMTNAGTAIMGIGSSIGEGRAANAARAAITSPLLEASIEGARGMVLNIAGGSDLGLFEVNEAAEIIHAVAHPDANIIFGAVIDDNMGDEVRVTVIAAGFERWEEGAGPDDRTGRLPRRSSTPRSPWTSSPTPRRRRTSSTWVTTISTSPPSCASDEVAAAWRPSAERIAGAGGDPARVRVRRGHQGFRSRRGARRGGGRVGDLGENYASELVAKAGRRVRAATRLGLGLGLGSLGLGSLGLPGAIPSCGTSSAPYSATRCRRWPRSSGSGRALPVRPKEHVSHGSLPGASVMVEVDVDGARGSQRLPAFGCAPTW